MTMQSKATPETMARTIANVRARFIAQLDGRILDYETLRQRLQDPEHEMAAMSAVRSEMHKIAGVAATIGFADIGHQASELEALVDSALMEDGGSAAVADALDRFLDDLEVLSDAAA